MSTISGADFKNFIKEVGKLIDARAKTTELVLKAHTESVVQAAEERIKKELRAELASKEDIKDMATKQDIARLEHDMKVLEAKMATKEDIKDMVRKQDIKDMATKQDIKDMATKQDIARLEMVISNLEKDIKKLEAKVDGSQDLRRIVDDLLNKIGRAEEELESLKRGIKSGMY